MNQRRRSFHFILRSFILHPSFWRRSRRRYLPRPSPSRPTASQNSPTRCAGTRSRLDSRRLWTRACAGSRRISSRTGHLAGPKRRAEACRHHGARRRSRSCRRATSPAAASTARTCRNASTTSSRRRQESGLITSDQTQGPMYGHGFATLFLGEVYGMTGDEQVKEKLQKAIRLIQKTQNAEGGWRYQPVPYDADISVTICQVMALRARARRGHQGRERDDRQVDRVRALVPEPRRRLQLHGSPGRRRTERFSPLRRRRGGALLRRRVRRRRPQARARIRQAIHPRPRQCRRRRNRRPLLSTATTTPSRRCSSPAANTGRMVSRHPR